ncbi:TetR family transcriptional regulator [Tetragenococcus halophilus subsp. flandriensis]|uniref:TetR/AcrR family transcriptional regulator n=1 Tax=Tetragenococcus halophilus TaxID=51669 RepID=UPI0023EA1CB6|nr:TetR/AcrR family transcriptional regulator [Tetragenococcus halophilus]GMA08504.1 TetR family transcriptional regulator [Tetragenococcus halophilus subsp. flandriensis]
MQLDKKQTLFTAARELFLEQGFKKTNIAAITKKANVAVGTFYKYYSSKEEIFYEVYQAENEAAKYKIVSQIDTSQSPKETIKQFITTIIQTSKQNPILAEWYQNSEVSQLITNHDKNKNTWQDSLVYSFLIENIERWQEIGEFRQDIDMETTLALFNALVVVDNHKEEVRTNNYPQILEILADMIVDGLSANK